MIGKPQSLISWEEAFTAATAVVVRPLQDEQPENALELFLSPAGIASHPTATTGPFPIVPIGVVGVEFCRDSLSRQGQNTSAKSDLDRLEIQLIDPRNPYEDFNLPEDLL